MVGQHVTRIVAANGVTYGSLRRTTAWWTARCPLTQRPYRGTHDALEPPLEVLDYDHAGTRSVANLGSETWARLDLDELPQDVGRAFGGRVSVS